MTAEPEDGRPVHALVGHAARPCRFCGQMIVLARLDGGKLMPIDVTPDADGNVAIRVDGIQAIRARVLRGERPFLEGNERLHMPHWATCPNRPNRRRAGGRRTRPAGPGQPR